MPAYVIDIEHRDDDQVFSYYHGDGMLHFNVTLLARLHKQMPDEFRRITMDLTQENYDLCIKHRGIEEPKITNLTPKQLREPGYSVVLGNGLFTIVDGHHRLVRRWRGGVRVMDFWITHRPVWEHCLVPYGTEAEAELVKAIPPRVTEPKPLIASAIMVHRKDIKP